MQCNIRIKSGITEKSFKCATEGAVNRQIQQIYILIMKEVAFYHNSLVST